jgi:hypothetical protein
VSNTKASTTRIIQKENKMNETNWCVVSFGSSPDWLPALKRLKLQTSKSKIFKYFEGYTDKWVYEQYGQSQTTIEFIEQNKRGFGLWFWKAEIILDVFKRKPEIEGVLYIDAGCEININPTSKIRLLEYIKLANEKNGLAFELPFKEIEWTEPFVIQEIYPKLSATELQIAGGILFLPNTTKSLQVLQDWSINNSKKEYSLLRGKSPNNGTDELNSGVVEHRFDQSIISLIWKKNSLFTIPDETFWHPNWIQTGANYPIWATRSKLRISFQSNKIVFFSYRAVRKMLQLFTKNKIII